ncbi:MAG TPA: extracellular solute-binding protein [Limnochordia bacterium]|nr:extracellular solute-binding protein [Limnochordia bacterium]
MRRVWGLVCGALLVGAGVAQAENVTLTVWDSDGGGNVQSWYEQVLIPQFEAAHPGVTVEFVHTPWGQGLTDKLVTSYAAGVGPDIVYGGAEFIDGYVMNGYVLPLDDYTKDWPRLHDFIPVMLGDATYQGRLYGLPTHLDFRTFLYNKQVFADGGLDPDSPPTTWQQVADAAKRLTKLSADGKIERAGIDKPSGYTQFTTMVWDEGGSMFNADKTQATFDSTAGIEGLSFWVDLDQSLFGTQKPPTDFAGGKQAMRFEGGPQGPAGTLAGAGQRPEDVMGMPPPPTAVKGFARVHSNWMAIGSQSKHPDLAWAFLAMQYEPKYYNDLMQISNGLPQTFDALNTDYIRQTPWKMQALNIAAQYGRAEWTARNFRDLRNALDPYLAKAWSGEMPVSSALHGAVAQWNGLLAEANGTKD